MVAREMIQEDLQGRVCMVTGANTGIGKVTAMELARAGARVLLACRSEDKTRPVIAEIIEQTGNEGVEFLHLDLSSLASVRKTADEFLGRGLPLHLLVNNAGLAGHRGMTADGFEIQFGVNHLGHYLLSRLLLPAMQEAPARIVNVSSRGHLKARGIDFDAVLGKTSTAFGFKEYCVSKLANVLFTMELANHLDEGVTTYALHPGVIQSEIWRRVPWPIRPIMTRRMLSVEEGAQTNLYCATDTQIASESGHYYSDCKRARPNKVATPALARQLWERSEAWCADYL